MENSHYRFSETIAVMQEDIKEKNIVKNLTMRSRIIAIQLLDTKSHEKQLQTAYISNCPDL